jgi:hypothetical protein
MKARHFVFTLALVATLFGFQPASSQGVATLSIIDMPGFPVLPQDTAYENQTYTFDLVLSNTTNIFVNSTISFHMLVDTIETVFFSSPQTAIGPGDTVAVTISPFLFTQPQFKIGNNIVVVWPVVNGMVVPVDSFQTVVYFVPLSSLAPGEVASDGMSLYPMPASDYLQLGFNHLLIPEHVRIWTLSGQLVKELPRNTRIIPISYLSQGMYFLEVSFGNSIIRKRFIKN